MSKFTVLFDANVLYPAPLRDLLMELARAELFRAKWSAAIQDEWIAALLRDRPDLDPRALARTRNLMMAALPDAEVTGYEYQIPQLSLPDPGDRHVLAAALHAPVLQRKDFPSSVLSDFQLELIHPDDFVSYQFDLDPAKFLSAVRRCRSRLRNPPKSIDDYAQTLIRQSLVKTGAILEAYRDIL